MFPKCFQNTLRHVLGTWGLGSWGNNGMAKTRNRLGVKEIESAISKAVKSGERSELSDGGGLVLRCPPSGVAKWTYAYRSRSGGGMRRVTLGTFGREPPALTLAAARAARDGEETRNAEGGEAMRFFVHSFAMSV